MKQFLFLLCLVLCCNSLFAQQEITIQGKVLDQESGEPIPYATVVIKATETDKPLDGATTDDKGEFILSTKQVAIYFEFSFIGYKNSTIKTFNIENGAIDLGVVTLESNTENLETIDVTAEKSTVEFKLDKRVFNVGKDISTTGMGALEVLGNVPSVNVNIEGEVSLRGNTGVQILINGKPSVLSSEGSNALGTLTADMIESIEVITNPSAKYQAEGTSGIINIILKKEEKKGFNGSVSVNTGTPANHSIGVSLNRRTENFNFFTQFGLGYRSLPRYSESINRNLIDSSVVESEGVYYRNENFYNITLGTDYHINSLNVLTLSGNLAYEVEEQPSETDFKIYEDFNQLASSYTRTEVTSATNPKYQYDLQYKKQFKDHKDHILLASTQGKFFGKEQESTFKNTSDSFSNFTENQKTETNFFQRDFTYKIDYTDPLNEKFKIETGSLFDMQNVGNDYAVYNEDSSGYTIDSNLTNNFEYNQKVLGIYGTGSYENKNWGIKLGLRLEHTNLQTVLTTTQEENNQKYSNFFPSVHTSYKFSPLFSLQAGYSKRIFRPRLWDLNPFFNISNSFNIRRGNPNLQPEYGDSFELTGILIFEKATINSSIYHLYTVDVVERVSLFEDGVNVVTPLNIGQRNRTGFELNGKYTPAKWFALNGDFNFGYFSRKGSFDNQNFDFTGSSWSSKLTSRLKLPADFELEITGNYQSGYKTVQGQSSGFAHANIGGRKKLWKGKAVINFSIRDAFASRIQENTVNQTDYYLYSFSQRGRFFTLGFNYSFGKGEAMTYSGRRR